MDACKVLGCSSKVTILLKEGCCFVLSALISFTFSEKKATSLPAIRKERMYNITAIKRSNTVAAGVKIVRRFKTRKCKDVSAE
jgi:hypothetical protein